MGFNERRAQLLANVKFLYGPDTEVLTLSHDAGHQAIAVRYDVFSASWTKFLHGHRNSRNTMDALQCLLRETEIEITKRLSVNGVSVPFAESNGMQNMSLHRRMHHGLGPSSIASSDQSRFEFIATPQSSVTERDIPHPCESCEALTEEPGLNLAVDPVEDEWALPISKKKKKGKKGVLGWSFEDPVIEEAVSEQPPQAPQPASEPLAEVVDDWGSFWASKKQKKGRHIVTTVDCAVDDVPRVKEPPAPEPEPVVETAVVEPTDEFDWGFSSTKKSKKKKSKSAALWDIEPSDQPTTEGIPVEQPVEVAPAEEHKVEAEEVPAPEPNPEDDPWAAAFLPKKGGKKDKKKRSVRIETPPPEPEIASITEENSSTLPPPESGPDAATEESIWDAFSSQKDTNVAVEEVPPPAPADPEPEPEPEPSIEFGWGSFSSKSKKSKKKKASSSSWEVEAEPQPPPEPMTPELVPQDTQWDFSSARKGKNKEEAVAVEESSLAVPEPEPVSEYDGWGSWGLSKKEKRTKAAQAIVEEKQDPPVEPAVAADGSSSWTINPNTGIIERSKEPEPVPEPISEDDDWGSFVPKKKKKGKKGKSIVQDDLPLEEERVYTCTIANCGCEFSVPPPPPPPEEIIEAPPEVIETTLPQQESSTVTEATIPEVESRKLSGHTVVLKIHHTSNAGKNIFMTMLTLEENTRQAIFNAVTRYLDSKFAQVERSLEIVWCWQEWG
ncbi:uncharacterized protein LY89DRAFT_692225 [Mollisia scopiformis]|uniref:Uncharacterized protein n=1 Tax=Mollisia scopiformis TaxID=149040 RepID=A0A132B4D1_MOLSC|nr:uncharacterized protein LY89DRAFT_692225 [Mollisia scopiformis]KUJ06869.1 hypothetical protein LY89DRAFT_692225 [Mollisia scopiformis]